MRSVVLVMAKAPVPGLAKTRLGAQVGNTVAARLAADGLLDTLDVCETVFPAGARHLALAGDLTRASGSRTLAARLARWTVHAQRGDGFAARLANAHADVAAHADGAAVVQIGTDTPHLTRADLAAVAGRVGGGNDAVLGAAEDGGWWVLAVACSPLAESLRGVEMSTAGTYDDTLAALRRAGARVAPAGAVLRDVDTVADAAAVATAAPLTRFARRWSLLPDGAPR